MEFAAPTWRPIKCAFVTDGAVPDAIDRAVASADGVDLVRLSPNAALDRLEATSVRIDPQPERIDCLVCPSHPGGEPTAAFVAAVRDRDPDVPIVVTPDSGSVAEAADVTAAGADRYLTRVVDGDRSPPPTDAVTDEATAGGPAAEPSSTDASSVHDPAVEASAGDESTAAGPPTGLKLLEAIREITENHDAVRIDRLESQMLRTILEDLQLAIFAKDLDGRHLCASDRVTSAMRESVVGKTDRDLYEAEIGEQAIEAYEDDLAVAREGKRIIQKAERHETTDGDVNWLRTTKVPWRDESGEPRGLIGITETIDEEKAREAALERERRRLEAFASFASHDLRNPVSIASGYLDLARETGDEAALDKVEQSLERMSRLIDDVLALVEPGDADESLEWLDLASVVEGAWTQIGTPDASLSIAIPDGVELHGGEGLVTQLFENLLRNAVEHGGQTVAIEVGLLEDGFYVADDGPGIDAEDPSRVFEYGFTTGGSGLGLAIAQEVAEFHRWAPGVGDCAPVAAGASDTAFRPAASSRTSASIGREPPAARGYDGACFAFRECVLRTPAHRRVRPGDEFSIEATTDVGGPEPGTTRDLSSAPEPETLDASIEGAALELHGGGRNLWRNVEEYHLAYAEAPGDVRIVARLVDLDFASEYSKAGLLLAGAATDGQPLSFLGAVGVHGCETIHRRAAGEVLSVSNHPDRTTVPIWFRLDRIGPRVTCSVSADGEDWTPIDQHVLDVDADVVAGLAVCSHNDTRLSTAIFDHVRVERLASPE